MKPIKKSNLYEQAVDEIQKYILDNDLKPGDRLPTESELTQSLGISRTTLREALQSLKSIGLIESKQKQGMIIKDFDFASLTSQFSLSMHINNIKSKELAEARAMIEFAVLPLVIERADDKQIEKLHRSIDKMIKHNESGNFEGFYREDLYFHTVVLKCSKNTVLHGFYKILREHFNSFINDSSFLNKDISSRQKSNQRIIDDHRKIVKNIENKNFQGLKNAIKGHLYPYNIGESLEKASK
ncbi:MAG: FadR/GntR family transcriptional regulator [Clostridia bacterium]|nr:FadR/GntR family transcriptional regulator [Clostridia bacterium]